MTEDTTYGGDIGGYAESLVHALLATIGFELKEVKYLLRHVVGPDVTTRTVTMDFTKKFTIVIIRAALGVHLVVHMLEFPAEEVLLISRDSPSGEWSWRKYHGALRYVHDERDIEMFITVIGDLTRPRR